MVPQATQASYMQSRGFIVLIEIEYLICRKCVLPYKLRCHTRISSPEKSRNNTREKIWYFFTCVWYRQSAADMSLPFGATRSGWWMNGKAFTIHNTRWFVGIFPITAVLKTGPRVSRGFLYVSYPPRIELWTLDENSKKENEKECVKAVLYIVILEYSLYSKLSCCIRFIQAAKTLKSPYRSQTVTFKLS